MRIIAGRFKGLRLAEVGKGDPKSRLRPTSDRAREALFSHLLSGSYGDPVTGVRVLDLFAGTGALGLEALSRGADRATFVERGRIALSLLSRNIEITRTSERTRVLPKDATRLPPADAGHHLVFLDPPYGRGLGECAVAAALAAGWIAPGALLVWEESAPPDVPDAFAVMDRRAYGGTHITVSRYAS